MKRLLTVTVTVKAVLDADFDPFEDKAVAEVVKERVKALAEHYFRRMTHTIEASGEVTRLPLP